MRFANLAGRMTLLRDGGGIDVHEGSGGQFPAHPNAAFEHWREMRAWAAGVGDDELVPYNPSELRAPSPEPRQVFGIGLNYQDHVAETGRDIPAQPATFTKFPTCITGPDTQLKLPSANVDWEVELVVVMGIRAHRVAADQAWAHVAGLTVGNDFSERVVQRAGPVPQFSLGKSFPGFGPTGPWLVTPDELVDPDDLELECKVNGEPMQHSRTSLMMVGVPDLIAHLSGICPLVPGDLIFTGTPSGVGVARTPPRFLAPGDEVLTRIEGIGELRTRCTAG